MPVKFQKWIYRTDLKTNPEWRYVFGDNVQRSGYGGQAKEMRSEPNAIGVVTKFKPTTDQDAFFNDDNSGCWAAVVRDLTKVVEALTEGRTVVIPEDGLGTGLSMLPQRAPKLNTFIAKFIQNLAEHYPLDKAA